MSTFEFNGIAKPYLILERGWSLPAWAPVEREFMTFPGRAGGVQTEMRTGMRRFPLPIIIRSRNFVDKKLFIEDMASWLIHEDAKPLTFSKYPGRTLYARIEGSPDFEQLWKFGEGTINVVCADPYEYGNQKINDFQDGLVTLKNTGSVDAMPVYEIDVLESITHLDIISDSQYFRIGEPTDVEKPAYNYKSLVLHDTMKTLLPWSVSNTIDNGYVAGIMLATQAGFRADNYGAVIEPKAWQGPSVRRAIGESGVKDFQIDVLIDFLNYSKETGMIEIYLLDAFSNVVAKIGFEDVWPTIKRSQAKFQLGNVEDRVVQHHVSANNYSSWNDFKGMLRLVRRNNVYVPYFAVVKPDGTHAARSVGYSYNDESGVYKGDITHIKVALRKWPGSSTSQADMTIKDIKIWRYNEGAAGIPYIADAGDKIIVDTAKGIVMINGEIREDLKDHFSDFFDLPPGESTLLLQPSDQVKGKVRFRERYR